MIGSLISPRSADHLKKDFGSFGGKHLDDNDSVGAYTSMITCSDIAEDEDPGAFIIGDLGVAICTIDLL